MAGTTGITEYTRIYTKTVQTIHSLVLSLALTLKHTQSSFCSPIGQIFYMKYESRNWDYKQKFLCIHYLSPVVLKHHQACLGVGSARARWGNVATVPPVWTPGSYTTQPAHLSFSPKVEILKVGLFQGRGKDQRREREERKRRRR